ncbi:ABC-2 family transporter protein [Symmachiella dynata]|uniref:ABC-2 family transporter protein n=1 Tax=Symmachiella dynata TaxID=2527995 RepID=A0A517ZX32_9PLAN|nr:ABC transporter permease [Symmachiella dynata]QDU47018.1 ABC-2 family transporter protein [Symmachiella dynata]
MSFDPIPFDVLGGLSNWAIVAGIATASIFLFLLVMSLLTRGASGPGWLVSQIGSCVHDWISTSPRRVFALSMLTFREAWRRKIFAVGVIFVLLIMFAGWFLSSPGDQPDTQVKVLVSFVLTSISWLILPLVVLLACWGIPDDIKARSMHTVVTKPVYRSEIVLGRIFGYAMIGTVALVVMGAAGYLWLDRQVVDKDSRASLTAKVPVYGNDIIWLDQQGQPAESGINTGDVWEFRSYIPGNTKARATWVFDGVGEDYLRPDPETGEPELRLESSFQVFRSYIGDADRGIRARYTFVNEDKDLRVPIAPFEVKEFHNGANITTVPRTLPVRRGETVDLIDDLVKDGKLRVEVECLTSGQYLGMARPDLFIRLPEHHFAASYCKALVGVWMMMAMAVVLCVGWSCVVKGPVATLASSVMLIVGKSFSGFFEELAAGNVKGGGVLESMVRIYKHTTPNVELEKSTGQTVIETIDAVPEAFLKVTQKLVPNFGSLDFTEYTANGFDVPFSAALLPGIALMVGHCLPWIFLAYVALKYRELESK